MNPLPVQWVLVVYYGPEAHRATYGRDVQSNRYTKDYIQLSRTESFIEQVSSALAIPPSEAGTVPIRFRWCGGSAEGALVMRSSDRPHLKWETHEGAPAAWKMTPAPTVAGPQTLPGNPDCREYEEAENERRKLKEKGAGQPFLVAVKLRDEDRVLHLRVFLQDPAPALDFANLSRTPSEVQELAGKTSRSKALAWNTFDSGGVFPSTPIVTGLKRLAQSGDGSDWIAEATDDDLRAVLAYALNPGHGLFFDQEQNHDCWLQLAELPNLDKETVERISDTIRQRALDSADSSENRQLTDAAAEEVEADEEDVSRFDGKIAKRDYSVADTMGSAKIRGAAQQAFAKAVKGNYGWRCAITGVSTDRYLVAAHIVPWSADESIRLDPSNGLCLSLVVDKAFEVGHLRIEGDLRIRVQFSAIDGDEILISMLAPYDGAKLTLPTACPPNPVFLKRRREMFE